MCWLSLFLPPDMKHRDDLQLPRQLLHFDKDNIDPKRIKGLQKYINMEDFTPESVGKVSKAAQGLCMWAKAMDVYARVAKEVEPKKAKLAEANAQLSSAMATLNEKQANLQKVQDKVAELESQLNNAMAEKKKSVGPSGSLPGTAGQGRQADGSAWRRASQLDQSVGIHICAA